MKKIELIIGIVAIIAVIFKLFHIPFGSILAVLSFSSLSIFYFVFSFALFNNIGPGNIFKSESYKNTTSKKIIGAAGLGFALSALLIGALFKLQLWPGANMQLMTGLVFTALILLIATFYYFRSKADYYKKIFGRIAIYGTLGLLLYLTPTGTLVDVYYKGDPEYATLFKKVLANPEDMELRKQFEKMRNDRLMKEYEEEMKRYEEEIKKEKDN